MAAAQQRRGDDDLHWLTGARVHERDHAWGDDASQLWQHSGSAGGAAAQQQQGPQECRLISGPVAISAQLVLLVVVVVALSVKRCARVEGSASAGRFRWAACLTPQPARSTTPPGGARRHRERPRRPLNVWLLDIGKQACSAGAGHTVGMIIAIVLSSRSPSHASECGWYFVVYFMDCTLGLTLAITFHKVVTGVARWMHVRRQASWEQAGGKQHHPWWEALVEIGHYGDANQPNMRKWGIQVAFWVGCVVTARSIVGLVLLTLAPFFASVTTSMDRRFEGRPSTYLYTVMVCIPLVVNVGQAWIQDQVRPTQRSCVCVCGRAPTLPWLLHDDARRRGGLPALRLQVLKWKHKKHPSGSKREEGEEPDTPLYSSAEGSLAVQLLNSSSASSNASVQRGNHAGGGGGGSSGAGINSASRA